MNGMTKKSEKTNPAQLDCQFEIREIFKIDGWRQKLTWLNATVVDTLVFATFLLISYSTYYFALRFLLLVRSPSFKQSLVQVTNQSQSNLV